MIRLSIVSLLFVCTFAFRANAEQIDVRSGVRLLAGSQLADLDPTILSQIKSSLSALPQDWRETSGTDVFQLTLDGWTAHVQVFPDLAHPGKGDPQCCLVFAMGGTEYWVKLRGLVPTAGSAGDATVTLPGSQPSTTDGGTSIAQVPEPNSVFLLGVALTAAVRRLRTRR